MWAFWRFLLGYDADGEPVSGPPPLMTLVVLLLSIFRPHRVLLKNFRWAINFYGKVVTRLPYPLASFSYDNRSGLDLSKGPFIFIFNHRSSSDPFLVSALPVNCER